MIVSAGRLAEFPANVEKLGALHASSLPLGDGMKRAGLQKSRSINYHETSRVSIFSRSLSGLNRLHSRAEYRSPLLSGVSWSKGWQGPFIMPSASNGNSKALERPLLPQEDVPR